MSSSYEAQLVVAASKSEVPAALNDAIVIVCKKAIKARGVFTIALSGGSLPSFLSSIQDSFGKDDDPQFSCWHVILADERCVPTAHDDSNLGALKEKLFSKIPVPAEQVYGINQDLLSETSACAADYEAIVKNVLEKSEGQLDLAVLGFGPDGHTCSLFPEHKLLTEDKLWVAPIEDSPKPPPCRITLTYPVLNQKTRHAIFCGAGGSKSPILQAIFASVKKTGLKYVATMKTPAPYPCGAVLPDSPGETNSLTWVVDADAMEGVSILEE